MIACTKIWKVIYFLCFCVPDSVISRRKTPPALRKYTKKHHYHVGDSYCFFFCWKSQKHHGFCWGGKRDPYHFPVHNMWKKTKRRLLVVLAYPEAKARVRKTILKQKQDLFGVMSSKSFKRKPIGACWFQRIVFEEHLHPTKKLWKKNMCFTLFLTTEFWR